MKRQETTPQPAAWEAFVLANGWRASAYELGHVLGQPAAEIECLRKTGACTRLAKGKGFAELFTLWHGRAPADQEWPAPRKGPKRDTYEWQAPELAFLAGLVGRLSATEIVTAISARLREVTGDPQAARNRNAVQLAINRIGLQSYDVVGGITTSQAGREIGSNTIVHQSIRCKKLQAFRVGRLWVIPREAWEAWKAQRTFPPKGFVQLTTLKQPLGIKSDKLSEWARAGLVPTAIRCNPYGKGDKCRSTQFGTWWIDPKVARKLIADRRAGKAMPWHTKSDPYNLQVTFKLWQQRQHPKACETCAAIWGEHGAPRTFDEYSLRYPPLAHGAKRHLTRAWTPGLTLAEVAEACGCSRPTVAYAVKTGMLAARKEGRTVYVTRTAATRWKARRCPSGDGSKSWIAIDTARDRFLFTSAELRAFIAKGRLKSRIGIEGAAAGTEYVSIQQCRELREQIGFTEAQAAARVGVTVARFRHLLAGVDWRQAEKIPLVTVQAVIKRLQSSQGYTIEEAAAALQMPKEWVLSRRDDGTIRVSRAPWDDRRLYITEPMMQRLRDAKGKPARRERLGPDWLLQSFAALEAGVSATMICRWADAGELDRRPTSTGWRYHREAVRARARIYWGSPRLTRAVPPEWLQEERAAGVTPPLRRRTREQATATDAGFQPRGHRFGRMPQVAAA